MGVGAVGDDLTAGTLINRDARDIDAGLIDRADGAVVGLVVAVQEDLVGGDIGADDPVVRQVRLDSAEPENSMIRSVERGDPPVGLDAGPR